MQVPSGKTLTDGDLDLARMMAQYGFIRWSDEPFTLKSGVSSHVYVFGREDLTDNPKFEWAVGRAIARLVWKHTLLIDRQPCLIGVPTAGTPLAQATAMVDLHEEFYAAERQPAPVCHRYMREVSKSHGAHSRVWVNGRPDSSRHTYWMVDNVVTNGGSKVETATHLEKDGYPRRMPILIFVDRQQGAIKRLEEAGFTRIVVGYNLLDLTFAFQELGLWPKEATKRVEEEIHAHQFA